MTLNSLNKKAEELFNQYQSEQMFYAIDDGNFWFSKDKSMATQYSLKLKKQLFVIKRDDIQRTEESDTTVEPEKTASKKNKNKK